MATADRWRALPNLGVADSGQEQPNVNSHVNAPRMIEALEGSSGLQLYQLKALIEAMLAEPRRAMAACARRHLGHAAQVVDFRDGEMLLLVIPCLEHETQATLVNEQARYFCVLMRAVAAEVSSSPSASGHNAGK